MAKEYIHEKRKGRFYISDGLIENEQLIEIFYHMKFIPLRVEYLFYQRAFEYIGISFLFEEVNTGEIIPEYEVIIDTKNNSYTIKKV